MTARALHYVASVSVHPAACGRWAVETPSRYAPSKGAPTPGIRYWNAYIEQGNAHRFCVVVSLAGIRFILTLIRAVTVDFH